MPIKVPNNFLLNISIHSISIFSHSIHFKKSFSHLFMKMASSRFASILMLALILLFANLMANAQQPADSGSLTQCGDTITATDNSGTQYKYIFHCKTGDSCVNNGCRTCSSPYGAGYPLQCSADIKPGAVDRCNVVTNICEANFDLNKNCGVAFTKSDNQTYYFNCADGSDCKEGKCVNGGSVVITKCNRAGLFVTGGKCQGLNECMNVQCANVSVPPPSA